MNLSVLTSSFIELTGDAVAIGHLEPGAKSARLVHVNKAFVDLFGFTESDILGCSMDSILDGDPLLATDIRNDNEALDRQSTFFKNINCIRADGTRISASVSVIVVKSSDEKGHFVCATYRNLTDGDFTDQDSHDPDGTTASTIKPRLSDDDTQEKANRLLSAMNTYREPVTVYDKNDHLCYWNVAFAASITDNPEEIRSGLTVADLLRIGLKNEKFPAARGREEDWLQQQLSELSQSNSTTDVEVDGNIHQRIVRSTAQNGDKLVMRFETTEIIQQRMEADRIHARLVAALNAYPDPIVIYDKNLKLVCWNDGYATSMTDAPEDLIEGMHLKEVLKIAIRHGRYPDAVGQEEAWVKGIIAADTLERDWQDVELDGDIHHRLLRSRSSNGDYVVIRLNSTELVRQKRAAEATQARLIAALNAYPAPFVIYDANDCLVVCNDAYRKSMANNPDDLEAGMHRTDVARVAIRAGKIANAIGREEEWMSNEHQSADVSKPMQDLELPGDIHHRLLRSRVENGDLVILRIDTTELVRQRRAVEEYSRKLETANQEITYKALHDDLTGLGNRRYLSLKFDDMVKRRSVEGGDIAALHIDLDRFKQINDTMGHLAGDEVLLDISMRIRDQAAPEDIVARIGGDEFVILLRVSEGDDRPEKIATKLLTTLSRPMRIKGKVCRVGASIGMARTPLADVNHLLTNSDVALYKAKRRGRGQLGVFDRSDLEELQHTKEVADDLLVAIENSDFEPFYQPQIDAGTGQIVGIEALARWRHPHKGTLPPAVFLPVATDLNVAADIDRIIFEKAIAECERAFGAMSQPLSLSFNVSENRVNHGEFDAIREQVRNYSGQISFELLETIFLEEQDDEFLFRLNQLRDLGIGVEVDDFGSGRASVVALQRINPDRLKIDRRLASLVAEGSGGLRLLRSIIEIGHALEMGVTAEGVETREQAEILAKLGCDRLQGYYFAKPMAFPDLLRFIELHHNSEEGAHGKHHAGTVSRKN